MTNTNKTKQTVFTQKETEWTSEREFLVEECSAIALCDNGDENCRQKALLVSEWANGEHFAEIVFGWEMPKTDADWADMCEDSSAWELLHDEHKLICD